MFDQELFLELCKRYNVKSNGVKGITIGDKNVTVEDCIKEINLLSSEMIYENDYNKVIEDREVGMNILEDASDTDLYAA